MKKLALLAFATLTAIVVISSINKKSKNHTPIPHQLDKYEEEAFHT